MSPGDGSGGGLIRGSREMDGRMVMMVNRQAQERGINETRDVCSRGHRAALSGVLMCIYRFAEVLRL